MENSRKLSYIYSTKVLATSLHYSLQHRYLLLIKFQKVIFSRNLQLNRKEGKEGKESLPPNQIHMHQRRLGFQADSCYIAHYCVDYWANFRQFPDQHMNSFKPSDKPPFLPIGCEQTMSTIAQEPAVYDRGPLLQHLTFCFQSPTLDLNVHLGARAVHTCSFILRMK